MTHGYASFVKHSFITKPGIRPTLAVEYQAKAFPNRGLSPPREGNYNSSYIRLRNCSGSSKKNNVSRYVRFSGFIIRNAVDGIITGMPCSGVMTSNNTMTKQSFRGV